MLKPGLAVIDYVDVFIRLLIVYIAIYRLCIMYMLNMCSKVSCFSCVSPTRVMPVNELVDLTFGFLYNERSCYISEFIK